VSGESDPRTAKCQVRSAGVFPSPNKLPTAAWLLFIYWSRAVDGLNRESHAEAVAMGLTKMKNFEGSS
jgi:hypothetical protein